MAHKLKILIIEDEEAIIQGLIDVFVFHGYAVDPALDGLVGLEMARTGKYDLILLDVMLPGMDGFAVCEAIKAHNPEQAVIMLTAKTQEEDIITGLTLGADDYVAKPFSVRELVLRIAAVLKRTSGHNLGGEQLRIGDDLHIDIANLQGTRAGETLRFTRREVEILAYLKAHDARPVSRDELLREVWGYERDTGIETRTVDIHIAKLRRKIEPQPRSPVYLVTVRGAGYRLIDSQIDAKK